MKRDGRAVAILLTLASALFAVGAIVLFDQVEHLALFALVGVLFILCVAPMLMRVFRNDFDPFESIVPYAAMNFLYYGLGSLLVLFVDGVAYDSTIFRYLDAAAGLCTLGFACALFGYFVAGKVVAPRLGYRGARPGWVPILILYLVGFAGESMFAIIERGPAKFAYMISGFDSLVSQLAFLSQFAIFYVVFLVMAGQGGRAFKLILYTVILPTQLFGVYARVGNKTALFMAVGLPIIAYWYARNKIAWKTIIVFALISVFIVFPLYYTVRSYKASVYSQEDRIAKTIQSATREQSGAFAVQALKTVARRLAIVNSTAVVVRDCGGPVEYQMGGTLWLGVVSVFIPRILWPDKPIVGIGYQFAKTFHVITFGNYTQISPSQAGELYWNFHIPGVILGMFVFGFWLRFLYQRFGMNRGTDAFRLAVYVTLLYTSLAGTDGSIGVLEGLIIKQGLILILLEKVFLISASFSSERTPVVAGTEAVPAR